MFLHLLNLGTDPSRQLLAAETRVLSTEKGTFAAMHNQVHNILVRVRVRGRGKGRVLSVEKGTFAAMHNQVNTLRLS